MLPRYHQVRIEVQSSYLASSDSALAGSGRGPTNTSNGYSLLLQVMKVLASHSGVCVFVCLCVSVCGVYVSVCVCVVCVCVWCVCVCGVCVWCVCVRDVCVRDVCVRVRVCVCVCVCGACVTDYVFSSLLWLRVPASTEQTRFQDCLAFSS